MEQCRSVETHIKEFIEIIRKKISPHLEIERYDERFTSKMAFQTMIDGGLKKNKEEDKKRDMVSDTIILQSYLYCKNKLDINNP